MNGEKPLNQLKVLITRGKEGAKDLSSLIEGYGGVSEVIPLLDFKSYDDPREQSLLSSLHNYEWIVFTSKNGVAFFLDHLEKHKITASSLPAKFAAVGTKTEKYCESHSLSVSFVPDDFTGDDFVWQFISEIHPTGKVLVPKGNLARDVIANELIASGVHCDEWIVYETILPRESIGKLKDAISGGHIDILTFTSSSTVHHFMRVVEKYSLHAEIRNLPAACIGPLTKKTAEEYGLHVKICPNTYTVDEMVAEIIQYAAEDKDKS
ncbi:uroporphyrinogen-III synthase [Rossellomorea sp. NS-SX7]|uniref:uroporphyrinogen-III synthase n=1 Tax=Rossellomorea sp. NS-SX7 TaxID=3463856 RepID=UPI004059422A